jgi:hypothetical protein
MFFFIYREFHAMGCRCGKSPAIGSHKEVAMVENSLPSGNWQAPHPGDAAASPG